MKRRTNGFTLVEMVMSITITAVIGLAVAGASIALSSATSDGDDYYNCIQMGRGAMKQLRQEIEKARLIVGVGRNGTRLILWSGDANDNGTIDMTELRATEYDPSTGTITAYSVVFPPEWSEGTREAHDLDLSLADAVSFSVEGDWNVHESYISSRTLGTDVESLVFSIPDDGPVSRLVRIHMTVGVGDRQITLQESVALRASATGYVCESDGVYVLELPR